ncbi:hypothetical protein [Pseudoteredinibacter isoporae]|uniref:Putative coiled-coil protein SlyX n=1 Tax=Pseudoteredinibacter isoporae TaxID=570281 RepID=A0A7X0JTL7_9GAMM|nr:hypothetical protein [Pseudoteredinibacter isoporae]MBB6521498.1 putative coiled-coil protein SlyX [Pseudoteredinibacter isoporae]NHO87052.1 hypothetical protein [Pseudoteredinibacter isoporae]NIB22799.1 hypothetical protein [Pseudoteredinibacter isoporae]
MKKNLILAIALVLQSCASAKLEISVDLYDRDPSVHLLMTPRKAHELANNLAILKNEAEKVQNKRISLARQSLDTYLSAWQVLNPKESIDWSIEERPNWASRELSDQRLHKADQHLMRMARYKTNLNKAKRKYKKTLEQTIKQLNEYVSCYEKTYNDFYKDLYKLEKSRPKLKACLIKKNWLEKLITSDHPSKLYKPVENRNQCILEAMARGVGESSCNITSADCQENKCNLLHAESEVLTSTSKAIHGFSDIGDNSEKFSIDWIGIEYEINRRHALASVGAGNPGMQALMKQLGKRINQSLEAIKQQLAASGLSVPSRLRHTATAPSTALGSSLALANELEALRNDLPVSSSSQTALHNLVTGTARFTEQLDRLRDAGDPIWRTVTDPANERHWQKQGVKTAFYAEGDASVVVVRDDPMHYRVVKASNNPATLINNQLLISKVLLNSSIDLFAGISGLPSNASKQNATAEQGEPEPDEQPPTLEATSLASLEAQRAQRRTALKTLAAQLRFLKERLSQIEEGDAKDLKPIRLRLESVLKAYKPLLLIKENDDE